MGHTHNIAIVTGASKGIGLATVKALLSKGMSVAGWSRNKPEFTHPNFKFYPTNVGNIDSVNTSYNQTIKDFGQDISVLINNAGIGYAGLLENMPVDEWEEMFKVNVHGVFYCSQMVIHRMKEMGYGHIVNIASIAGKEGIEKLSGYSATKFALRGLTQALYKEVREYGIKVTSICPGSVKTDFFEHIDHIVPNDHMMRAEDIAQSIIYCLETSENYHPVELEVRPLMPKGRKTVS